MNFFFVPCWAWVLFLSIRSQCLFPEGSHQMKMCSQLTYCTFAIFPSKDVTVNPLWGFCSVYLEFYTYWCVFSSKPWLQISLCWCGASIAVVSGIPVHPQKIRKIPKNTQNSSKYTQNYTQVYFIPEIQRKWYTQYPYLSYNIPYSRFKKPLYTVYPKTLADPDLDSQKCWMLYCHVISFGRVVGGRWLHLEIWLNCI